MRIYVLFSSTRGEGAFEDGYNPGFDSWAPVWDGYGRDYIPEPENDSDEGEPLILGCYHPMHSPGKITFFKDNIKKLAIGYVRKYFRSHGGISGYEIDIVEYPLICQPFWFFRNLVEVTKHDET